MNITGRKCVSWEYADVQVVRSFTATADIATMKSRLPFWSPLERHLTRKDPVRPARLFRHGIQVVYSRTKGGVDCGTQFRSEINSSSTAPEWEQKHMTFFFNTFIVHSYTAWRLLSNENHFASMDTFGSLDKFRNRVNQTSSIGD